MDIFRQFIDNPVRVWLALLLLGVGGVFALLNIGRLEDPAFTIKTAVVVVQYPGASAQPQRTACLCRRAVAALHGLADQGGREDRSRSDLHGCAAVLDHL